MAANRTRAAKPKMGQSVIYLTVDGQKVPGIVTEILDDGSVELVVFASRPRKLGSLSKHHGPIVGVSKGTEPGTWRPI